MAESEQVSWMAGYMASRYGAWAHEQAFNWYDRAGNLPPGVTLAVNDTGEPEDVDPGGGDGPA